MSAQTHTVRPDLDELINLIARLRDVLQGEVVGTGILAMLHLVVEGYCPQIDEPGMRQAMMTATSALSDYIDEWNLINMEVPSNLVN